MFKDRFERVVPARKEGAISRGKNDLSQSLQMISRSLMTPEFEEEYAVGQHMARPVYYADLFYTILK